MTMFEKFIRERFNLWMPTDSAYCSCSFQTLPYLYRIPGGLRTDMAVYFQGTVSAHAVM